MAGGILLQGGVVVRALVHKRVPMSLAVNLLKAGLPTMLLPRWQIKCTAFLSAVAWWLGPAHGAVAADACCAVVIKGLGLPCCRQTWSAA